jgi:hypothetical protein
VRVDVIDAAGRVVDTIFDGMMSTGSHQLEWNSKSQASGMYIIRTTVGKVNHYEKTILLK